MPDGWAGRRTHLNWCLRAVWSSRLVMPIRIGAGRLAHTQGVGHLTEATIEGATDRCARSGASRRAQDPSSWTTTSSLIGLASPGMRMLRREPDPRVLADPARLPPGQTLTEKWPVLHYGRVPTYDIDRWRLRVFGEVKRELSYSLPEVLALPAREVVCDIHCVTTWSRFDNRFLGVPLATIADLCGAAASASFVEFHCHGGFTTSVPIEVALADDALLAYRHDGAELSPEHGYPLRALFPRKYFWKSAKWVEGVEFRVRDELGFWERNGYNNSADPWREERYW